MRNFTALLFSGGLAFLLFVLMMQLPFGESPRLLADGVLAASAADVGAANIVTSVVLAYRGIDTLGELSILFAAAAGAGLILRTRSEKHHTEEKNASFLVTRSADLMFPLLLIVGFYIVFHGHLTPGGGFQGGVILAIAFFLPVLARPGTKINHGLISLIEGLAGVTFIMIGLWAMLQDKAFLQPLFFEHLLEKGQLGALVSAGTLPLLYIAVGLKVGSELAGLLASIAATDPIEVFDDPVSAERSFVTEVSQSIDAVNNQGDQK